MNTLTLFIAVVALWLSIFINVPKAQPAQMKVVTPQESIDKVLRNEPKPCIQLTEYLPCR